MIMDIEQAVSEAKDRTLRSRSLVFKTQYITADSTDLQMTEKARRIRLGLQRPDEQSKEDAEDLADKAKRKINFSNCESNEGN